MELKILVGKDLAIWGRHASQTLNMTVEAQELYIAFHVKFVKA